jgi:uncharacterized protein (DUF4213/DUF364 family)
VTGTGSPASAVSRVQGGSRAGDPPPANGIAHELVACIERIEAASPLPRVRALHLPPPSAAGSKDGEFCALELEDGSIGLSYVLLDDALRRLEAGNGFGLAGADALQVARRFAHGAGIERLLGFAAVNAATSCLFARAGYAADETIDSIGRLDPRPGDHVGMIGLFRGLVDRIVATGARLTVVELKPELAGEFDGWRVTLDPEQLATCNKVLSTSTVLLNDTLDRIVSCCRTAQAFTVVGPGAGCIPDPLFARGVTLMGGTQVSDRAAFVDALRGGGAWSRFARKVTIGREDYPGFEALLGRARGR